MMQMLIKRVFYALSFFMLSAPLLAAESTRDIGSFSEVMEAGGWAFKVILVLSAVTVFLVVYFLLSMRAAVLLPRDFIAQAAEATRDGDVEALRTACRNSNAPAARILAAATEEITVTGRTDYLAVRDAVEDEGARQANVLWSRLQYMMDIAGIAPMVGLLGTVFGMLDSFSGMKIDVGAVRPDSLAQGVSKALITTAGGLIVGIAALILYAIFRGRVGRLIAKLEDQCGLLMRQLIAATPETK